MIKGRFTFERTDQGRKELDILVEQLAPMLGPKGHIKVREDDRRYIKVYVELYAPAEKL